MSRLVAALVACLSVGPGVPPAAAQAPVAGDELGVTGDLHGRLPSVAAKSLFGWNFSGGQGESDAFNTFRLPGDRLPARSFCWYQYATDTTAQPLMCLAPNGDMDAVGASRGATLGVTGNLNGRLPAGANGFGVLGWNLTGGRAEVDFVNTVQKPNAAFVWWQAGEQTPPTALLALRPDGTVEARGISVRSTSADSWTFLQGDDEIVTLGAVGRYPETNPALADLFPPGIRTRNAGLYVYRETYGTFGQAVAASIIANNKSGVPQVSGYLSPAGAGAGGERGSVALYISNEAPATLDVSGVTFDTTHVILPANRPLTPAEIAVYGKPGTFVETFTHGAQVGPFTGQVVSVSPDGRIVTVTGWWLQGYDRPGQMPTAEVGQPPPYTAHFGVVTSAWGQNTNVALYPTSRARSAFIYEAGLANSTGRFAPGALSNPLSDLPVTVGFAVAGGNGTGSGFWTFGSQWRRGYTATGIADDGAGFVYGDTRSGGTAFYSAQTTGAFLVLKPNDTVPQFLVDSKGNLFAGSAILRGKLSMPNCPDSANGLVAGDIWCDRTGALRRVP